MSIKVKAIETDLSHFSDKDGKSLGFRFVLKLVNSPYNS